MNGTTVADAATGATPSHPQRQVEALTETKEEAIATEATTKRGTGQRKTSKIADIEMKEEDLDPEIGSEVDTTLSETGRASGTERGLLMTGREDDWRVASALAVYEFDFNLDDN